MKGKNYRWVVTVMAYCGIKYYLDEKNGYTRFPKKAKFFNTRQEARSICVSLPYGKKEKAEKIFI